MAHGIIRTDNMEGTIDGKFLVSLYVASDIDNGNVVKVGALKTDEREVRAYSTPAATDSIDDIAIIASEEVDKTKNFCPLGDFYNKAGSVARGYKLVKGDYFAVTADALNFADGYTFVVGTTIVELMAGTKLNAVSSLTSGSTQVGTLEAIENDGSVKYYVFKVV